MRTKTSVRDVESSRGSELVSHDLKFHKGVNISLTQAENEVLVSSYKGGYHKWLVGAPSAHNGYLKIWKLRLADSRGALKKALEAKFSLTDQVTKLTAQLSAFEYDISHLKVRCGYFERKEEALMAEMSQQRKKLCDIIQEWDEVIAGKGRDDCEA